MAKGGKPDKQNQVMGMFSKIAREAKRLENKRIKEAKRKGEFYYVENPELLSIEEQIKYFKAKKNYEEGSDSWDTIYSREQNTFPFPYKFMNPKDK
jgi:hypothetical protein